MAKSKLHPSKVYQTIYFAPQPLNAPSTINEIPNISYKNAVRSQSKLREVITQVMNTHLETQQDLYINFARPHQNNTSIIIFDVLPVIRFEELQRLKISFDSLVKTIRSSIININPKDFIHK